MGMNVGDKKGGAMGDINVTPLVDVVLVLLIIFMVITQMLSSGIDVKLPPAKTAEEVRDVGQYMVLSITPSEQEGKTPKVYIDREELVFDDMPEKVLNTIAEGGYTGLLIKGSSQLQWKQAHLVMNRISEAGLTKMLIATDKEK